jgi:hypothetical protein
METSDRLKTYQGFAENSRKWVSVMDTKAGFISAMNVGLLTFIWMGAKLTSTPGIVSFLALGATTFALLSLLLSLWIVLPRISLPKAFGKPMSYTPDYEPVSFYAHVAKNFGETEWPKYRRKVDDMDDLDFAEESLEQHFTISHILYRKSVWLTRSGALLLGAVLLGGLALIAKELI